VELAAGKAGSWPQDKASVCCVLHGVCADAAKESAAAGASANGTRARGTAAEGEGMSNAAATQKYNCTDPSDARPDKWPAEKQQMCCIQEGIGCPGVDYRGTLNHLQPWAAKTHTTTAKTHTTTNTIESTTTTLSTTVKADNASDTTTRLNTTVTVESTTTVKGITTVEITTTVTTLDRGVFANVNYEGKTDACDAFQNKFLTYLQTIETQLRSTVDVDCSSQERDKADKAEDEELGISWDERKAAIGRQMKESGKLGDWRPDFSEVIQRDYCCTNVDTRWCKQFDGKEKYAYRCDLNQTEYQEEWVMPKKLWCCLHFDIGCRALSELCPDKLVFSTTATATSTTTATATALTATTRTITSTLDPQSCQTDLANWQNAWPVAKKTECCTRFLTFNVWPADTEEGCCSNGFAACEQSDNPEYDCEAAYPNWREAWSAEKQEWCCAHYKRGCHEASYECDTSDDDLISDWPVSKSSWCCTHRQVGCAADPQSEGAAGFDCSPSAQNTAPEWSQEQKRWCCMYEDVGCHELVAENRLAAKYTQASTSDWTPSPASALVRTWGVGVILLASTALTLHTVCRRRVYHLPVANQAMLLGVGVELE